MSKTSFTTNSRYLVITADHLESLVEYLKLGVDVSYVDFVNLDEELTVENLREFDERRIDFKKYQKSFRMTKSGKKITEWRWARVYYNIEYYNIWAKANGKPVVEKSESYRSCTRISKV